MVFYKSFQCEDNTSISKNKSYDYRTSHLAEQKARPYADQFNDPLTAKHLYWQLEQEILYEILSKYNTSEMHLLDFACGTGRIINFLEKSFNKSTGIDISGNMLNIACKSCNKSIFIQGDVTEGDFITSNTSYDVVTAFRFFLNAQPVLRQKVLEWIQCHLKENGILICNFHLNPLSLIGLCYRIYRWIHQTEKESMVSIAEAIRVLSDSHFKIIRIYGYGYLFYRRSGIRRSLNTLLVVERTLMKLPWLTQFARNFLIVAAKE